MRELDVLIVGGGIAGMAAACSLSKLSREDSGRKLSVLLVERDEQPGGVLRQCFHHGFGEHNLTGPEFADVWIRQVEESGIELSTGTEVLALCEEQDFLIVHLQTADGNSKIRCRHLVLAAGCYERSSGNLLLAGSRPEGIFTAGELQRMINLEGYRPGKEAVVIGSGDIGLIVARRLLMNGCNIKRIVEIQEKCPALERNKEGCLIRYQMPLQLNSRVIQIDGDQRISKVTIENLKTKQTEELTCDLLVTAAGLIPDRSLIETLTESKKITKIGNCERIYPSVEGILHSVAKRCREVFNTL